MHIIDCHTHTSISPDGNGNIDILCEKAKEIPLDVLAVTEHCEVNRFFSYAYYGETPRNEFEIYFDNKVFENAMRELDKKKKDIKGLKLISGIELGQVNADFGLSDIIIRDKRLDFTIASLHELLGMQDFAFLEYKDLSDCCQLFDEYLNQLIDIARWGKYDVLGHLTYPLRYMCGEQGFSVDIKKFSEKTDKILKAVIENNKGIEINTSGLRQLYGQTFPTIDIIRRYKELGGVNISVGSDAHKASDLASGVSTGIKILKDAGFDKVTYFENHTPQYLNI
jgi:histidinol-phosphatase (PHP family)